MIFQGSLLTDGSQGADRPSCRVVGRAPGTVEYFSIPYMDRNLCGRLAYRARRRTGTRVLTVAMHGTVAEAALFETCEPRACAKLRISLSPLRAAE